MSKTVTREEFEAMVGQEIGVSDWFEITQERIDQFADCTEDWQFIHVDPDRAAQTEFGGTVAHGMLTLSMLSAMAIDALPQVEGARLSVNYGFEKLSFSSPVPAGGRVRGRLVLTGVPPGGRGGAVIFC